jgi:hypothetical protein
LIPSYIVRSKKGIAMQRLLSGLASLPLLAGVALAAQPVPLNDAQMDAISAGAETSGGLTLAPAIGAGLGVPSNFLFFVNETGVQNTGTVIVSESPVTCTTCYLRNVGSENFIVSAQFGPIAGGSSFEFHSTVP